jgi:hypothetical protein
VQHTHDSRLPCFHDHRFRIGLGISRVYHGRLRRLARQAKLFGERQPLRISRRVVVVIVEAAFSNCHCAHLDVRAQLIDMLKRNKSLRIVRVHTSGIPDEPRIRIGDVPRCASGAEDIPGAAPRADADDRLGSILSCARDYVPAVTVERRVGEVRVAVDEPFDIPVFLGHFLSIQSSVGPAI